MTVSRLASLGIGARKTEIMIALRETR